MKKVLALVMAVIMVMSLAACGSKTDAPTEAPKTADAPQTNEAGSDAVEDTAYLNRCLQGLYTPGSVFKIVTLTAALDNLPGLLNRTFTCTGSQDFFSLEF